MNDRVYVLLYIQEDKFDQALQILQSKTGVRVLDVLEGMPNLIVMLQACDRQRLAKLTIGALASVESMTEDQRLLPVRYGCNASTLIKPLYTGSFGKKVKTTKQRQKSKVK
ncbi:MAG: hypothetical protein FJ006_09705 [Chloroflexi bacterium]|nr:hypothetical protein [Chloroflexota bacterium]